MAMPDSISREVWLALTTRLLTPEGLHSMGVPVAWGLTQLQELATRCDISLEEYVQQVLQAETKDQLYQDAYLALLDTRSSFFSPYSTYRFLRSKILPELSLDLSKERKLRIWCASCGPGQEVYSLAIMLDVTMPELKNWDIQILGTDLSPAAIAQAASGKYSQAEILRGLPEKLRGKYFELGEDDHWHIHKDIKKRTAFKTHNVLRETSFKDKMDIIFFRRTLGQLDPRVRSMAIERLMHQAKPSTLLVTGSRELLPANSYELTEREENTGYWEVPSHIQIKMEQKEAEAADPQSSRREVTETDIKKLKELLSASDLFENLPGPLLDSICAKFELHEINVGDVLVQQGKRNDAFFIVYEGSLPVSFNPGILRKSIELGQLFPGAIFGEMSLLLNQPANATIRADEEAYVFVGSASLFQFLQQKDTSFRDYVQALRDNRQAENLSTIEEAGSKRAVDAYCSGQENFEDLTFSSLRDDLIAGAPVSANLMRRLKFRGGTQLTPTDEDFIRLNNMVRSTRLFHGLEVGKIDAIMKQIQLWRFEEDSRIIKEAESGLGLFFVDRGQLGIEINRKMFRGGEAIQEIGPGSIFGELSILSGLPTCADVVSRTPVRVYIMSKKLYMLISTLNWDFRAAISNVARSRTQENISVV